MALWEYRNKTLVMQQLGNTLLGLKRMLGFG